MSPPLPVGMIYMLVDATFSAAIGKIERDKLLIPVQQMEARGATLEEITKMIRGMAGTAISDAQAEINRAP